MKQVRLAVLGTGTVVRKFHLPALVANPRARVTAICNLRRPSLEAVGGEFGIDSLSTDLGRIASDPQIDAVVIALPNYLHAPVAVSMLEGGKHVLCEKPMSMSVDEGRTMAEAAEAAGKKLMIAHVWRFSHDVWWLRNLIDSGRLGSVLRVTGHSVARGGPLRDGWFVRPETAGGGALADVGIHSIDTISYLFHDRIDAVRVTARTHNRFERLAVEDTASVQVDYDDGTVAEINAGWYDSAATEPHGAVEVIGTEGNARTLPPRWQSRGQKSWNKPDGGLDSKHPDDDRSIYDAQMDHFMGCILEDRRPACDGRQGVRDMTVLDAAYRSARSGQCVDLSRPDAMCRGESSD